MCVLNRLGEYFLGLVGQFGTIGLENVVKAKAELQLGTTFEERQIVVAAKANLKGKRQRLDRYVVLLLGRKVV